MKIMYPLRSLLKDERKLTRRPCPSNVLVGYIRRIDHEMRHTPGVNGSVGHVRRWIGSHDWRQHIREPRSFWSGIRSFAEPGGNCRFNLVRRHTLGPHRGGIHIHSKLVLRSLLVVAMRGVNVTAQIDPCPLSTLDDAAEAIGP